MTTHTSSRKRNSIQLAFAVLFATASHHALAQGCVVAHGSGLPTLPGDTDMSDNSSKWEASVSYRWFKSHRHFVGVAEQFQRAAAGDQVINRSNFVDLGLSYTINPRYNVQVTVPFVSHDRSQVVKNASGVILERFSTQATGLADVSVVANGWVIDPAKAPKGNLELGIGLSLPTGNDNVQDVFETFDRTTNKIVASKHAVDQSIQPGSGGYGIIFSFYGYRILGGGFSAFANGSYTVTPEDTNGVQTARSNAFEAIESIPDTYLLRVGVEYAVPSAKGVSLSLGLRDEGVMVRDVVGSSNGFRRPGYSIAVEPGIGFAHKRWSTHLYVPIAIQRNRMQSVPDKQTSAARGTYAQGDAAFADYLIMWNATYRF